MECPNCNANVSDGAAVCPDCDTVLDPSLFDAEPPSEEARRPRPAATRPAPRPGTKPGVKKVVRRPGGAPAPGAKPATGTGRPAAKRLPPATAKVAREDWRNQISKEDWEQEGGQGESARDKNAPPDLSQQPAKAIDAEALMKDWYTFIFEMSAFDKVAFFGLVGMMLSTVFPWKETAREGELLGVTGMGFLVLLLALAGATAVVVRVRKSMPKMNPILPWAAQLGALALALLWCGVFTVSAIDTTLTRANIGNAQVWASKPSFGVILAFISGVVGGLGTFLGLKDINK